MENPLRKQRDIQKTNLSWQF